MATQIHTRSSSGRQCRRLVLLCQSQSRRGRGRRARRREQGHVLRGAELCQWCLRRATLLALRDPAGPRVPGLPSDAGDRFGFRVFTCDEGISITDAVLSGWRQCPAAY